MKINKTNSQSFGWNLRTHYQITNTIAQTLPELRKYSKILSVASFAPDIKLSQTSFGYDIAHSFFGKDFVSYDLVPQNASDFYFDNLTKAINNLKAGNTLGSMIRLGNALHFLQDVAVPLHTKEECHKLSKILPHIKYESIATKQKGLIGKIAEKAGNVEDEKFCDCFLNTHKKASCMPNPYEIPKSEWASSVEESLENAYVHTFKFLKRFLKIKDMPFGKIFDEEIMRFFFSKN